MSDPTEAAAATRAMLEDGLRRDTLATFAEMQPEAVLAELLALRTENARLRGELPTSAALEHARGLLARFVAYKDAHPWAVSGDFGEKLEYEDVVTILAALPAANPPIPVDCEPCIDLTEEGCDD